ncbi:MAG: preprotein translocase subunit YajC [Fusicatenibacter sp.]|nr:preprotein translocase subunit YajC [Fusicatenibacter sp.]
MFFADATSTQAGAMSGGMLIMWIVIMFGMMYFLMIRPQKKEQKKLQAMLNDMEVGDAVVTTSGFYGIVIDITDDDVIVEFGNNKNCRIPMRKTAISEVEKPELAQASEDKADKKAEKTKK